MDTLFIADVNLFSLTPSLPNVAVTKNEASQLQVLLTPTNVLLQNVTSHLLLSFRKR
jgi:hypothetical protein